MSDLILNIAISLFAPYLLFPLTRFTPADASSLCDVVAAVIAGRTYFSWFHLGLALGLDYRTLKVIQNKCSDDNECLRDTLAAWLRQKDKVPQQGLPSWRSLTRALAHPLVDQRGLAEEIARKHKRVKINNTDNFHCIKLVA